MLRSPATFKPGPHRTVGMDESSLADFIGETDDEIDPDRLEGATYSWTPDGAVCTACGQSVEERWANDEGVVCVDCKEW